nr:hypothetical protein [Nostoc sp. EfeVER01]
MSLLLQHLYQSQLESVDLDSYSRGDRYLNESVRSPSLLTIKFSI